MQIDKEKRKVLAIAGALALFLCLTWRIDAKAERKTVFASPYVNITQDGQAWSFREGMPLDANGRLTEEIWYPMGESIRTGIKSELADLQEGEHYYRIKRYGEIPIGQWKVMHPQSRCIHILKQYVETYHGLTYRKDGQVCRSPYYSGWFAYCADCGEPILDALIYGSREAVGSVNSIPIELDSYYLCPYCTHLEMGWTQNYHACKAISPNRYRIVYDSNAAFYGMQVYGNTEPSFHMYNRATVYEGVETDAGKYLNPNGYVAEGYYFVGWNTKRDGTGEAFADMAELVENLSVENYDEAKKTGSVTLYARWEKIELTLHMDPNGGSYRGRKEISDISGHVGDTCLLDEKEVLPPEGYRISFYTEYGNVPDIMLAENRFLEWRLLLPAQGRLDNSFYHFNGRQGESDTIRILYRNEGLLLPVLEDEGKTFAGWYRDRAWTEFAGYGGQRYYPTKNEILYAFWTTLDLMTEDVYFRDENAQKPRIEGTIANGVKKEDGTGDNSYDTPESKNAIFHATGAVDVKIGQREKTNTLFRLWRSEEKNPFLRNNAMELLQKAEDSRNVDQQVWTLVEPTGVRSVETENASTENVAGKISERIPADEQGLILWETSGEYVVPANGYYSVWLWGAAGEAYRKPSQENADRDLDDGSDYACYPSGGPGATMEGCLYLEKGEILRVDIAGSSAVSVVADGEETLLFLAAEGGAASAYGKGGAAYGLPATEDTLQDFRENAGAYGFQIPSDGQGNKEDMLAAGKGGCGILNGLNGQVQYHTHSAENLCERHIHNETCYSAKWVDTDCRRYVVHDTRQEEHYCPNCRMGRPSTIHCWTIYHTDPRCSTDYGSNGYWTCNYCGTVEYGWGSGTRNPNPGVHVISEYKKLLTCAKVWNCEKEEGIYIETVEPSHGGLSYHAQRDRHITGNGKYEVSSEGTARVQLQPMHMGFFTEHVLTSIQATDHIPPEKITSYQVDRQNGRISFQAVTSGETYYYFFAESYEYVDGMLEKMSVTNVVEQRVESRLAGYYYLFNDDATDTAGYIRKRIGKSADYVWAGHNAAADTEEIRFTQNPFVQEAEEFAGKQYLHLAPVDVAGNIGDSIVIPTGAKESAPETFCVSPLTIDSIVDGVDYGSISKGTSPDSYYVRADSVTPFLLSFSATIGTERNGRICEEILQAQTADLGESLEQLYTIQTRRMTQEAETEVWSYSDLYRNTVGSRILVGRYHEKLLTANWGRDTFFSKAFVLDKRLDGRQIIITPMAGAELGERRVLSKAGQGLLLIPDGSGPVICWENFENTVREGRVKVTAKDALSGLAFFYVIVRNEDSGDEEVFVGKDGMVEICLPQDELIQYGCYTFSAFAVDNVGNCTEEMNSSVRLQLQAELQKLREPFTGNYKAGESARIYAQTKGYAESVSLELPDGFAMKTTEEEGIGSFFSEFSMLFTIPLDAPNGEYEIPVLARKGEITERVVLSLTVEGRLTEEIRTKLR